MKSKKMLFVTASLATVPAVLPLVVSCSSNQDSNSNKKQIEAAKTKLNNFIDTNRNKINENYVDVLFSENSQETNLFTILSDNNQISSYFSFNKFDLWNTLDTTDFEQKDFDFEFIYGIEDSFGNSLIPFLNDSQTAITIPVLVYYFDNNVQVSKYINLFSLSVEDSQVNLTDDNGYNGSAGKKLVFKNKKNQCDFETVPIEMIQKYFDFYQTVNSNDDWKKLPLYPSNVNDLQDWKGKTLQEVRQISQAIKQPGDYYDGKNRYQYSIINAYFDGENRKHAVYVIRMSLSSQGGNNNLINDAKQLYNLTFEKEYTILDKRFDFAYPSDSEIESYKSNNQTLLTPIIEAIKNNILFCVPTPLLSLSTMKNFGVDKMVERFEKSNIKDFKAPESFWYTSSNGQRRLISFSFVSLTKYESEGSIIEITMKATIDKGDLAVSSEFTKKYDINTGNFVQ